MNCKYLFFYLLLWLISGCQKETTPTLHVNAYCHYDEQAGNIRAEATFFEGDTLQTVRAKVFQSGVSFLGSGMKTRQLPGGTVRYEQERKIALPEQLPLFFKETADREKTIMLPLHPIRSFNFSDSILSASKGFSLTFDGEPLSAGEKLIFLFSDKNNQNLNLEIAGPVAGQTLTVTSAKLASLAPGPGQVYLVRTNLQEEKDGYYDLTLQTEFYSKITQVAIGK